GDRQAIHEPDDDVGLAVERGRQGPQLPGHGGGIARRGIEEPHTNQTVQIKIGPRRDWSVRWSAFHVSRPLCNGVASQMYRLSSTGLGWGPRVSRSERTRRSHALMARIPL